MLACQVSAAIIERNVNRSMFLEDIESTNKFKIFSSKLFKKLQNFHNWW